MIYNEEQKLIADQAQRLLGDRFSSEGLKTLLDHGNSGDTELWQTAIEMGWPAINVPVEYDGLGMGHAEVCLIEEQLGKVVAAVPFTANAVFASAVSQWADAELKQSLLTKITMGECIGCLAFAEKNDAGIPAEPQVQLRNGQLFGEKVGVVAGAVANHAVVYAREADTLTAVLALVELDNPEVRIVISEQIDNNRSIASLHFDGAEARVLPASGRHELEHLLDFAAVYIAFEQTAGAQACLEMAREYALERHAFGQPIAKFQSVKHNLADMYILIQLAKGAALKALEALSSSPNERAKGAAAARIAATKAYEYAAKENIQIHGGIGVTWEADCHLHYRRSRSLAVEYCSLAYWHRRAVKGLRADLRQGHLDADLTDEAVGSPEHQYRLKARAWLAEHAPDFGPETTRKLNEEQRLTRAREWMKLRAEHGYSGINIPASYGGAGGTGIEKMIFDQEEIRYETPSHMFHITLGMPIPMLLLRGTEEQKQKYVGPALRGENIWCQLFSEPAAGSDLAALRMTARRDRGNWILNGQKVWTSWAQYSDYGIIITRHDPSVTKHAGLTYFFLDLNSPGVEVRPIRKLWGESEINEVFFDNVVVPDSQRLGEVGEGFRVALETLMIERYSVADVAMYGPRIHRYVQHAKETHLDGMPAIENGATQQAIAETYAEQQGLASINERSFAAMMAGEEPGPEGSIGKLVGANSRQRMSALALDWGGPSALTVGEYASTRDDFSASWLEIPGGRVAGGTDETLRNTIAERVLGLPQDYRPDKGVPFNEIGK